MGLMDYLLLPFVQRALIAGVLISIPAALLGVILVSKHFSMMGDSLSHVAFTAMAVSMLLKLGNFSLLVIIPVTVLLSIYLMFHQTKSGDAEIAILSVASLGLGYFLMNVFGSSANVSADVCSTLFGGTSILTLSTFQVWECVILTICIVVFFKLQYPQIFLLTFDEEYAAIKYTARKMELEIAILLGITISLAMDLVGSLLVTAFLVFSVKISMNFTYGFKKILVGSVLCNVITTLCGECISILWGTPVGATIIMTQFVLYLLTTLFVFVRRRYA